MLIERVIATVKWRMDYLLPKSAGADESLMAHGYSFSSADVAVYRMGYNDGMYGRTAQ